MNESFAVAMVWVAVIGFVGFYQWLRHQRWILLHRERLAGVGAAIGLIVALGVMKVLSNLITLQNVSVLDAGAFAASLALVALATALAAYAPARRATRLDPSETLRAEG